MKAVVANLGFILQTSGVITLLAVIPGFIYGEQTALIAFFITSSLFLVFGFAMNALSERKELDFKSSCILISIVFFLLGIIGAVPYLYTNTFSGSDLISKIVNSFFESASGYTTTGFSMITNPSILPKSMVFYRALTQWIGGIGIVFIILVFFNSAETFEKLGKAIGFARITSTMKNTYLSVFGIYAAYTLLFFGILYALGVRNWINNIAVVFSGISTGGFSPVDNLAALAVYPVNIVIGVLMIIGATSFSVHYKLFAGKILKAPNFEFVAFLIIVAVFTLIFALITGNDLATAFFHVASASSTTGYGYIDLGNLAVNAKMLLFMLMFVGASTYSTSGGVKIKNIYIFFKSIPWLVRGIVNGEPGKFRARGEELSYLDIFSPVWLILIAATIVVVFAFVFTSFGFSLADSVFAVTSALSNSGLSVGITNLSLPLTLKLLLILAMIIGRIGIIAFFVALIPMGTRKKAVQEAAQPTPQLVDRPK